jgi:Holliday junction resolvasome RuvABC endonuclease subunit
MEATNVLGLDVSTKVIGIALLRIDDDGPKVLYTKKVQAPVPARDLSTLKQRISRIASLRERAELALDEVERRIDLVAVEQNFARNQNMAGALNQAIGAALTIQRLKGAEIVEVRPNERLAAIGLSGRENYFSAKGDSHRDQVKLVVIERVRQKFGLQLSDDEADAVCIALAGYVKNNGGRPSKTTARRGAADPDL